jgi:hypothetical protein
MRPLHAIFGLLIVMGTGNAALAAPNLVTNGSFEDTTTIGGSGWTTSGAFTSEGFDYMVDTDPSNAQAGNHSFAGGAIGNYGYLSQSIATAVGTAYDIRLWLVNPSGFADGTAIQVLWDGGQIFAATDILGSGYTEIVLNSVATAPLTIFSIGLRDDSFFLNVDSIAVTAVPEPSTVALLVAGLAFVASRRRLRSSRSGPASR